VAWVLGVKITLILIAIAVFFASGAGNPLLRRLAIRRINAMTGGQAEIRSLSIQWLSLHASAKGVVIHGKEPEGTEPLFSAEEVRAGLKIDSFWGRTVSLTDVLIREPHLHVRVEKMARQMCPFCRASPASRRANCFRSAHPSYRTCERLILYNDVKIPLALEGSDLHLILRRWR
jgi:hypothetical protein